MELKAYGKAGSVAEEVFSSIRTVFSYNGQKKEEQRFDINNILIFIIFVLYIDMKNFLPMLKKVV